MIKMSPLMAVIIVSLVPLASAVYGEPASFISRFQFHRRYPLNRIDSNIHHWNRISDLALPLRYQTYRNTFPTSYVANLKHKYHTSTNKGTSPDPLRQKLMVREVEDNQNDSHQEIGKLDPTKSQFKKLKDKGQSEREEIDAGFKTDAGGTENKTTSSSKTGFKGYNSYRKFNPGKYLENSAEWQMAMIRYLLDMRKNGQPVQEVVMDQSLKTIHREAVDSKLTSSGMEDPVICRIEPLNLCYRFDRNGKLYPIGDRRPVRHIRVYKRSEGALNELMGFGK